jgi:hypothetical protein
MRLDSFLASGRWKSLNPCAPKPKFIIDHNIPCAARTLVLEPPVSTPDHGGEVRTLPKFACLLRGVNKTCHFGVPPKAAESHHHHQDKHSMSNVADKDLSLQHAPRIA